MKTQGFFDGLLNVLSSLTNRRNSMAANVVRHCMLSVLEMRAIYKSGLGAKICKIKSGYALNDTLQFDTTADEEKYNNTLAYDVLKAARYMVGFGRGIIVLYQKGDDLSKPFIPRDGRPIKQRVFSGDMVTVSQISNDFFDDRYYKPQFYTVRGVQFHWSRVVDFIYYEPTEEDAPSYNYGGISEFEMIYPQLVNDGVVERASGSILEKNATVFYKVKGFREALQVGKDKDIIKYFSALEDNRSIYGAGIVDDEDSIENVTQSLTNLVDADNITLRRLAMVTGIPLSWLIGENVKGLNSTGDNERQIFQDMIETIQYEHLLQPVNRLLKLHGMKPVEFKDNQGDTARNRIMYEKDAIANALVLYNMGEDHVEYLKEHDIIKEDEFDNFMKGDNLVTPPALPAPTQPENPEQ